VILVVASRVDDVAQRLVAELPENSAELLTCLDLSLPGWRVGAEAASDSICIAGGRKLEPRTISGVVCLLPYIFEQELVHIEPEDRAYVASEMTAFLLFWLDTLTCPKLNAPTAACLSGPHWAPERWRMAAASAGLAVKPIRRSTRLTARSDPSPERRITVIVVGGHSLGQDDQELRRQARSLASAVGVDLLSVHFAEHKGTPHFLGADVFPDLSQPGAAEAIWDFFSGGRRF
jgi:hypothetical protein